MARIVLERKWYSSIERTRDNFVFTEEKSIFNLVYSEIGYMVYRIKKEIFKIPLDSLLYLLINIENLLKLAGFFMFVHKHVYMQVLWYLLLFNEHYLTRKSNQDSKRLEFN